MSASSSSMSSSSSVSSVSSDPSAKKAAAAEKKSAPKKAAAKASKEDKKEKRILFLRKVLDDKFEETKKRAYTTKFGLEGDVHVDVKTNTVTATKGLSVEEAVTLAPIDSRFVDAHFLDTSLNRKVLESLTKENLKELIEAGVIDSTNLRQEIGKRSFLDFCLLKHPGLVSSLSGIGKEGEDAFDGSWTSYMLALSKVKVPKAEILKVIAAASESYKASKGWTRKLGSWPEEERMFERDGHNCAIIAYFWSLAPIS